jgi:hypothetical protein
MMIDLRDCPTVRDAELLKFRLPPEQLLEIWLRAHRSFMAAASFCNEKRAKKIMALLAEREAALERFW